MALSSVIVQANSSKINQVVDKLTSLAGVTVQNVDPAQIIALLEADTLDQIQALALEIENLENVLGVYPVYVTVYDDEE